MKRKPVTPEEYESQGDMYLAQADEYMEKAIEGARKYGDTGDNYPDAVTAYSQARNHYWDGGGSHPGFPEEARKKLAEKLEIAVERETNLGKRLDRTLAGWRDENDEKIKSRVRKIGAAMGKRYGGSFSDLWNPDITNKGYFFTIVRKLGENDEKVFRERIVRVYSLDLKHQNTLRKKYSTLKQSYPSSFTDRDGCYRDAPGWGGHSAG
jgi:hypothetical protein